MQKIGLDPDRPAGLVMFGGHGSRVMRSIAKRLDDTQLILVCGHNLMLAAQLRARALTASALAWCSGSPRKCGYYMRLSDFFIGKPGPGSISEAVQHALPVIVVRNAWTMPQERYNTEWVRGKRAWAWCWNHSGTYARAWRRSPTGSMPIGRDCSACTIARYSKFRTSWNAF